MSVPLLTAALIVRDEQAALPACLRALARVAGHVVVYDTGSDRTREVAAQAGAVVVDGYWDGDFARARNAALALVTTPWALVVDADEEAVGNPAVLARALDPEVSAGVEAFACVVRNLRPPQEGGPYSHPGVRVLRVDAARYAGRVHEQPGRIDGAGPLRTAALPQSVLHVVHHGYAERDIVRGKAVRNAALARTQLAELVAAGAPPGGDAVATTLLDLGRALAGAGQTQDAVDAFETLRAVAPVGCTAWQQGSDHLARLLLADGHDQAVVLLAEQLRAAGAPGDWCDWLRAQALLQLGHAREAAALLSGIRSLVDTGDRTYDPAPLNEARLLLRTLTLDA